MTIREIRQNLFLNTKHVVFGADELSNKEARDLFYSFNNQEQSFNVIENNDHLLIW
jgi:hypothetical protein